MRHQLAIIVLAASCAGCVTPGNLSMPQPAASQYFTTIGGSFSVHLDEARAIQSVHYSLVLKPRTATATPLYLRAIFENPADAASPYVVDKEVQPGGGNVLLDSPDAKGFQPHNNYEAEVLIFDTPDRSHQIGQHIQYIRYSLPPFAQ